MNRATRGFTLAEIAIAISILAMMGTLTWGTIGRSFDAYEAVSDVDARYHNARTAMARMTREISMAFLADPPAGMDEDRQYKTLFRGKAGMPFHTLDFTSFAHQILKEDAKESDQAEIGYFALADTDDRTKMNLMRREDPRLDSEPDKGGRAYVLAEDLKSFKLRFWDEKDKDWTDEWDTETPEHARRLPTYVEITLSFEDPDGKEVKLMTKTRVFLPKVLQ